MARIDILAPFIKKWEGGYSDNRHDRGGKTNKGITMTTYEEYRRRTGKKRPTLAELININDAEWIDVLRILFWNRWKADEINDQRLANCLVDWLWSSGKYGIMIPQQLLGVEADGIVGQNTINKLNEQDADDFFKQLINRRATFVKNIVKNDPTQRVYLKGWLNRIYDLQNWIR